MDGKPASGAAGAGGRLHYLDNLRALAMLSGVAFHASLAFSPLARPLFPTADRQVAPVVDLFAWFLHAFRMPLFFVIAGFIAALLVRRHGMAGMFGNRLWRVGIPFVLFWPPINYALTVATLEAARTVGHPSPLLAMIRDLLAAGPLPQQLPGTSHLWFLYYLLYFYVLVWVARSLDLGRLGARFMAMGPGRMLGFLPLLLVPALVSVPAPFAAPESFFPQFWAFGFFGLFFAFGYLLQHEPDRINAFRPYLLRLLLGCFLLYGGFLLLLGHALAPPVAWLPALLEAYLSVWATVACLCLGRALLDQHSGLLRYLSEASYWTYLVHLPVLLFIQYRLMDSELPWPGKLAVALGATLAVCLLSYQWLVRRTVLAEMLGGRAIASRTGRRAPA